MHRMSDSHSAVLMRAMRAMAQDAHQHEEEEGRGGGGGGAHSSESARSCCSRAPARRSK